METLQEAKESYVKRLWEWMNVQGFALSLDEVRNLHDCNFTWYAEQTYVVVVNINCQPSPIRRIVELKEPYESEIFTASFYEEEPKMEGDEFVYCSSVIQMFNFVSEAEGRRSGNGREAEGSPGSCGADPGKAG